jgi:hypothetical protein
MIDFSLEGIQEGIFMKCQKKSIVDYSSQVCVGARKIPGVFDLYILRNDLIGFSWTKYTTKIDLNRFGG